MSAASVKEAPGRELHDFASRLYPICRSITGNGVRQTLKMIGERIPLGITEVKSGSRVFDWEVPLEWNIEDAAVTDPDGRRVVDFQQHNLHLVSYSEPMDTAMSLEELAPRLYSIADHPDRIPYRTSYYRRSWGFCMRHAERERLRGGKYRVQVNSSLQPGSLTFADCIIPGRRREEVLFLTHVCHPSLANDNTSGMAIATQLAQWIASEPRRYTYRFAFVPATIGSLCWLKQNEKRLDRIKHGLVLALLGDPAPLTYKSSRRGNAQIDAIAQHVVAGIDPRAVAVPFSPYGYDERQLCSPGFNLPVGRLTRSVNAGFSEYHSSADDLSLIGPGPLQQSYEACQQVVRVLEGDASYVNLSPKGEPLLGKRGLYGSTGGKSPAEREFAMLWVLNQSDGGNSLFDIARKSGLDFNTIREAATALAAAKLLREKGAGKVAVRAKAKVKTKATAAKRQPKRSARRGSRAK